MARTLPVEINRRSVHSIEPGVRQFETSESFVIELTNRGSATHVHINVDDGLAEAISLDGGNHFVEAGRTYRIEANVDQRSRPVSGHLKVVTGYGAQTAVIDVSLIPPEEPQERTPIEVDERLAKPQPRSREQPARTTESAVPGRTLAAGALVVLALLFVVVGSLVAGNPAVILGVGIVLAAIGGAAVLLYST
ncbi:DUF7524 family protein [Halalkalicoccus jeotgali]|uniref:Uncharacterized protein n=1 Tax=Halalkalicoccus jeotgali (strain DSM 18796 / CECT 7217 / JCM 14584 / KCTC 4019 / B3) TaxID=795797 RepID=D8J2W5_HALJB|nr:hypothetical protein [Halalkalicoccus jeotgali]ADJ15072.1 hypothetical protein HacjB3_08445 [Halalkalicoccus jeotgali B3]ELY34909.1 hypothetical protein C497_14257 [Halalkalicoccus jeotgali B3]